MKGLNKVRNKSYIVALLCICALIAFSGCTGKKKDNKPKVFSFERYNTASKGLPSEDIVCIAPFGEKICAGSKKGLYIYDGEKWDVFNKKTTNSLGSDEIVSLQYLNGKLWIGTDGGACFYDGNTFRSVYTGGRARAVSGNQGGNEAVGTAFGVLVGGNNLGSSIASNEITTVLYDKNGSLWVGSRLAGVYKLEGGSPRNYKGPAKKIMGSSLTIEPASPSNCKLPSNLIKVMIPYKGALAVGTTGGLCLTDFSSNYDVYTAVHKDYVQKNMSIVEEEVAGNSKIPGNKIFALAASDNDELLFVVTDLGLGILKDKEWLDVDTMIPGLPSTGLNSVAWCKGDLWIGTEDEGLLKVSNLSSLYADAK